MFFKFINFYRKFIRNYLKIIVPLINLIKIKSLKSKNSNNKVLFPLVLEGLKEKVFKILKEVFTSISIFTYFNFNYKTQVKIDALDYITIIILFQKDNKDILRSIIFIFYKIILQEYNYKIYNKEFLVIIKVFKEQYFKLIKTLITNLIKILTNYKNLKYFIIIK